MRTNVLSHPNGEEKGELRLFLTFKKKNYKSEKGRGAFKKRQERADGWQRPSLLLSTSGGERASSHSVTGGVHAGLGEKQLYVRRILNIIRAT